MGYAEHVIDLDAIEALLAKGATKIAYHPNGALASVEFAHEAASAADPQNEHPVTTSARTPRQRGGLVPREPISST